MTLKVEELFGRSHTPLFGAADLLALLLKFANRTADLEPIRRGYKWRAAIRAGWQPPSSDADCLEIDWAAVDQQLATYGEDSEIDARIESTRRKTEQVLKDAIAGRDSVIWLFNEVLERFGPSLGVAQVPSLDDDLTGKASLTWHWSAQSDDPAVAADQILAFATSLLMTNYEACLKHIRVCQLPECGGLFLATKHPDGGPLRQKYCDPKHMLIAHQRNAAARKRRSRDKRKRAAASKPLSSRRSR